MYRSATPQNNASVVDSRQMATDTLNPIAFVDAVRHAGGRLWPHDNLDGFIIWTPTEEVSLFLLELSENIRKASRRDRGMVACYLAEHPSKCDLPPW